MSGRTRGSIIWNKLTPGERVTVYMTNGLAFDGEVLARQPGDRLETARLVQRSESLVNVIELDVGEIVAIGRLLHANRGAPPVV